MQISTHCVLFPVRCSSAIMSYCLSALVLPPHRRPAISMEWCVFVGFSISFCARMGISSLDSNPASNLSCDMSQLDASEMTRCLGIRLTPAQFCHRLRLDRSALCFRRTSAGSRFCEPCPWLVGSMMLSTAAGRQPS